MCTSSASRLGKNATYENLSKSNISQYKHLDEWLLYHHKDGIIENFNVQNKFRRDFIIESLLNDIKLS